MATLAQSVPEPRQPLAWFWDFLKQELTPYPVELRWSPAWLLQQLS